ncbi:unnamed protein product [Schistosoma mattheei]|uniref:Uncharacterized protein n=1 Tax=Schistosoma mattheei TaxID=31246 RepID=A0A183PXC9_9TREM|nr:unnamed protein product [Schistosoma mattheei]
MHDVEFSGTTFGEHVQATEVGSSRDTISYTDYLFASSNQSHRRQIMHDVEFSGTTFGEHVQATEVGASR